MTAKHLNLVFLSSFLWAGAHGGERYDFPTFGLSLKVPGGWTKVAPTREGHVAQWARGHNPKEAPKDVIALETALLDKDISPLSYAKGLAKAYDGEINSEVMMGGIPAVEVRSQHRTKRMSPRQTRITAHQGHLWILSFWSSGRGSLAKKTMAAIAKSVRFTPFEEPSDHLELREAASPVLNGAFALRLPEAARPVASQNPTRTAEYAITHLGRNRKEFILKLQEQDSEGATNLEQAKRALSRQVARQFPGCSELEWKTYKLKGANMAVLSPVVLVPKAKGGPTRVYRYGLVFYQGKAYLLSGAIDTIQDKAVPKYHALMDRIFDSFLVLKTNP